MGCDDRVVAAAVNDSVMQFLDDIADHLHTTTDPACACIPPRMMRRENLDHR